MSSRLVVVSSKLADLSQIVCSLAALICAMRRGRGGTWGWLASTINQETLNILHVCDCL